MFLTCSRTDAGIVLPSHTPSAIAPDSMVLSAMSALQSERSAGASMLFTTITSSSSLTTVMALLTTLPSLSTTTALLPKISLRVSFAKATPLLANMPKQVQAMSAAIIATMTVFFLEELRSALVVTLAPAPALVARLLLLIKI